MVKLVEISTAAPTSIHYGKGMCICHHSPEFTGHIEKGNIIQESKDHIAPNSPFGGGIWQFKFKWAWVTFQNFSKQQFPSRA